MQTITEALIARIIRSKPEEVAALVAGLPETARAQVAIFCNARAHLRVHGRAIAATCSLAGLSWAGGPAAVAMLDDATQDESDVPAMSRKRQISLARYGAQANAA